MAKIGFKKLSVNFYPADEIEEGLNEIFSKIRASKKIKPIKITESINFNKLVVNNGETTEEFDIGDDEQNNNELYSRIQVDGLLMELLKKLNDREKVILMFQLLRDSGYMLRHEDCAKTISITREGYMSLLKDVRIKSAKILRFQLK